MGEKFLRFFVGGQNVFGLDWGKKKNLNLNNFYPFFCQGCKGLGFWGMKKGKKKGKKSVFQKGKFGGFPRNFFLKKGGFPS